MGAWNIFRILGDLSHILSKCILMFSIHRNRSAEGVSMITQVLYAVVFCARYTDIFRETSTWNLFFKVFYILSSFYIIVLMRWIFPRTRERETAWKLGGAALGGSLALSPFVMMVFERHWTFFNWFWDFSQILESVCVLPQLLLLRQTTIPTVIDSGYILTLGSYRAFYILNWLVREFDEAKPNTVSVMFGIVQTALYVDFAWVYYTRQRIKLRYGGVVDADDMRQGWLLKKIFGKRFESGPEDEESAPALGQDDEGHGASEPGARRTNWGARGISISADDGVHEQEAGSGHDEYQAGVDPDAKMKDPDELARALDDDDDEDDDVLPSTSNASIGAPSGLNHASEWRDN